MAPAGLVHWASLPREPDNIRYGRPRTSPGLIAVLLVVWCAGLTAAAAFPYLAKPGPFSVDQPVRVSHHSSGLESPPGRDGQAMPTGHRIFVPRGATPADESTVSALEELYAGISTGPRRGVAGAAVALLAALCGLGWFGFLHRLGGRFLRRREQIAMVGWLVVGVLLCRGFLSFVPLSAGWLPVLAFVIPVARQLGRPAAVGWSLVFAAACGTLVPPYDPVLAGTFALQATAMVFVLPQRRGVTVGWSGRVLGTAMFVGGVGYLATQLASFGSLEPLTALSIERGRLWGSLLGGALWPLVGLALEPAFERAVGNLSRSSLLELSDIGNPLLRRIASRAPGSWAHSRMMANLAESAAQRIGADALLIRVGAYYHDLGKADEPEYFVENMERGATSPHKSISPHESAQQIINHVRGSVRRGRAAGLPEAIIDFMHSHHGSGRVEYFYQQARNQAEDPDTVSLAEFTYPGQRPQDRENGILAIVDAMEAAARTLVRPTRRELERLVHKIVFTKLAAAQLDDSSLTPRDLRIISNDLIESLLATAHDRIAYPWQQEETQEMAVPRAIATDMSQPSSLVPDASATISDSVLDGGFSKTDTLPPSPIELTEPADNVRPLHGPDEEPKAK